MDVYWKNLNNFSKQFLRKLMRSQQEYIRQLESILDSAKVPNLAEIQDKVARAKEINNQVYADIKKVYADFHEKVFDTTLRTLYKTEKIAGNFDKISYSRLEQLKRAGLQFLDNYTQDMVQLVQDQLYIAYMNGESFFEAYQRIRPYGNNKARPQVMIRDQMARISQIAVQEGYKAAYNAKKYEYYWEGPDDERTTDICKERKAKNPYTYEEMIELNPHPHIQCRHRWVRRLKED